MALIIGFLNIIFMVAFQNLLPPFLLPLIFFWLIPFTITIKIEGKTLKDLGIIYKKERILSYILYTALGFVIISFLLVLEHFIRIQLGEAPETVFIYNTNFLGALLLQIVGIGFPEELFFRGYLFSRLNLWLGYEKGVLISSLFFGFGHFASRLFQFGSGYLLSALAVGFQTFLAGIVLGVLFSRTESVYPPAVCHILLNLIGPSVSSQILR
jgi:membrane protease YdiL (CAAX protease family)